MKERAKVAYLGPQGTFSQAAAVNQFGYDCDLRDCDTIDDVFSIVASEEVDYGVVPVENSTEGAVNNTQDCLINSTVQIVGEVIVPIRHCLLRKPGAGVNEIQKIASHQQSLAQCRNWIQQSFPQAELIECPSNAQAAKLALGDNSIAAIAGSLAAKVYGLSILQEQIQDQQHNSTRFLVLANHSTESSGNDKTSVLIYTENRPGALFRILKPFENLQVSLTKIETRPAKNEAWAYVFFIDFEGHVNDKTIIELFRRLVACTAEIKILGSYPIFVPS
ncbi:MAG: prephenate dehydratase [Pseudohongiellaceae bacterium]